MGIKNPFRICGMHETMISRIAPYTLRGFLYYQGEEDDRRPDSYYALLRRLIECWRWEWHDDELPFMLVQLPMFMYKGDTDRKNWCKIREAQMRIFKTVKNTGIAVISDCGEYGNIHPINKKPVGERLFLQALYHVYGFKDADAFGPIYRTHSYRGDGINIILDNAENGIMVIGSPDGFEIAGADKKFYRAKAEINGNSIFIRSDNVKKPKYARYAWTNYMEVKIFGRNGIPLAPFRTHTEDE
jgi:sialate O-acetylesterase